MTTTIEPAVGAPSASMLSAWQPVVAGVGFTPQRSPADGAARLLARDGAVILQGFDPAPDRLVQAAAAVLGASLRQLFSVRHRGSQEGGHLAPHTDGFDVMADVHGRATRLRDPDEDYVLIQSARQPDSGGENVVLDSYRLVDQIQTGLPELHDFLTRIDVDYFGGSVGVRGVPSGYHVRCHVEHTRKGRRIVRMNGGAMPFDPDPDPERIEQMLALYTQVVEAAAAAAPRVLLEPGEILLLDNYRCMHGRDPYDGDRLVYILTLRTCEAM